MLTATYSLVAISNEQNSTRRILHKVQQYIRNTWNDLHDAGLACMETAFSHLIQLDEYCRNRKVELYLIPAIRKLTDEADVLLDELEALSASGWAILHSLGEQINGAFKENSAAVNEVLDSMQLYCQKLLARLEREEEELFPLVQRIFSIEEWFGIAERFLTDDGQVSGAGKQYARPPVLLPSTAGQRFAAV